MARALAEFVEEEVLRPRSTARHATGTTPHYAPRGAWPRARAVPVPGALQQPHLARCLGRTDRVGWRATRRRVG